MIEWVEELRAGFTEEFGTGPKVVTLATVDDKQFPRARSVVCRRFRDDGLVLIASDARSEKNLHLRRAPMAEICVWLAGRRQQFRLRGPVSVISAGATLAWYGPGDAIVGVRGLREEIWLEMSESARALFFWPDPGQPLVSDSSQFPPAVRTGLPPDTFELLAVFPHDVEKLDLRPHPHRRRRWRRRPRGGR